jgi:hypothetical protein
MAEFLRRTDVGYPTTGDESRHYFVKTFEDETVDGLQIKINLYLTDLRQISDRSFHIANSHFDNYVKPSPAAGPRMTAMLVFFTVGGDGVAPP